MAVIKTWKVYGMDGHRQRESFGKSYKYDFQKVQTSELLKLTTSTKQAQTNTQLFALPEIALKNAKRNCTGSFPMGFLKIPELGKL